MLDDKDIQKLKEVLATKEDLAGLITLEEFDEFKKEYKNDFSGLQDSIQGLIVSIDKLTQSMSIYHDEYVALTAKVDKHEKWFQQVAEKLGLKLNY
ncbi:hypothetical protein KKI21_00660 [Patescibacteria group bacterium]|nr:hypothetical protein [Patescibacteria group bacterium]MCG2695992.1 hypothetical protein [Candidatus Portnoybacteria bacterium]